MKFKTTKYCQKHLMKKKNELTFRPTQYLSMEIVKYMHVLLEKYKTDKRN